MKYSTKLGNSRCVAIALLKLVFTSGLAAQQPTDPPTWDWNRSWSGIFPHLAYYNQEMECGTGAVVPWADRLWLVTYAPHEPRGSSDKLYEVTPDLQLITRPESIGGTPANRMIHRESEQLFIGPYAIDKERNVRAIPFEKMLGRPTGNARHLTDPENKIYSASMEEGFYEIDVKSLDVTRLFADTHETDKDLPRAELPGYHGKGLYSGQGVLVYANNGEPGEEAKKKPFVKSGVLAEWDGKVWKLVRRAQFTDISGPGGIYGNPNPEADPIWAIGWDHKSLLLMSRDSGAWHTYRLPKASNSYDGAHGWNTEWPRIRDIGEQDLLMTMHGMFWNFPKTFSSKTSSGIRPRSSYLKIVGDFARWHDHVVLGCDDSAKSEFLNKRRVKGSIAGPQSHSNLWFVEPGKLDSFGPRTARGAVWQEEGVKAGQYSAPFLFQGYDRIGLHLSNRGFHEVSVDIEVDKKGDGQWRKMRTFRLLARRYEFKTFQPVEQAAWVRIKANKQIIGATAVFEMSDADKRGEENHEIFSGVLSVHDTDTPKTGGLLFAGRDNARTLGFAATAPTPEGVQDLGYYELDADMKLKRIKNSKEQSWIKEKLAIPKGVLQSDKASMIFLTDENKRYRLPKNALDYDRDGQLGPDRVAREVVTERDLLNVSGSFYELPARNAGGIGKVRPIATHMLRMNDFCSYRGLLIMSGLRVDLPDGNRHIIRSDDGKTALWAGAIDDLWKLGKPRGIGGPWRDADVTAGVASDPYLINGYDKKTLEISHDARRPVTYYVQIDLSGHGLWANYNRFDVFPDKKFTHEFPKEFSAYWIRFVTDRDTNTSVTLFYE